MLPDPTPFLTDLLDRLERFPGQLDHLYLDHLCYRVATDAEYVEVRNSLAAKDRLLVESTIGGRAIATFRLRDPFLFRDRTIELLELPAPKPGRPYPSGYEHVEFVTDRPLPAFLDYLVKTGIAERTDINTKGLQKTVNPDLRINLPGGISVKFHERSLADIIRLEQQTP